MAHHQLLLSTTARQRLAARMRRMRALQARQARQLAQGKRLLHVFAGAGGTQGKRLLACYMARHWHANGAKQARTLRLPIGHPLRVPTHVVHYTLGLALHYQRKAAGMGFFYGATR